MDDFISAIRNLFNKIGNDAKSTYNSAKTSVGNAAKWVSDNTNAVGYEIGKNVDSGFSTAAKGINKLFGLPESESKPKTEQGTLKVTFDHTPTHEELENARKQIEKETGLKLYAPEGSSIPEVKEEIKETVTEEPAKKEESKAAAPVEDNSDVITYTYKPGDTFGRVLLNLGLSDGTNLWGPGGDVDFYTQQLREQNMLDYNGNVKLGIPFKLRRRK